ncbi:TrpD protein [Pseudoscourfieldia marina]
MAVDDSSPESYLKFVKLLRTFRVSGDALLLRVRSDSIIPDTTNRERTGLSAEHVHYIATLIQTDGFSPRVGTKGHDVPVLVRECPATQTGLLSLSRWRDTLENSTKGLFPPCTLHADCNCFYTSLGNGHFTQAMNLHRHNCSSIFTSKPYDASLHRDKQLAHALEEGVPALVLDGSRLAVPDRKFISLMLNSTHHMPRWNVLENGELNLEGEQFFAGDDGNDDDETEPRVSQFEALSKVLDAEELSALVRTKLGIDVDEAKSGYKSRL